MLAWAHVPVLRPVAIPGKPQPPAWPPWPTGVIATSPTGNVSL